MTQSVADRYELVKPLGEGGMGIVYDAIHMSTGRSVALKLLNVQGMNLKDDVVARFAREARAAGAISSRHIVQVLDAGTDPRTGAPFLAMERLKGEDLRVALRPLGLISVDLALRIVAQACAGLAKAHEAGVVHRDIKLGNIFLAAEGDGDDDEMIVKILDFGIAKIVTAQMQEGDHELTRTGTMIGSPQYMSPEQALGHKDVDARSDLWSLGVVLYRLLTGRTPQHDTHAMGELIVSICSRPAPPVQDFAPWVPPEVARVVHRALRLRREDRYPSAEAMLAELRALLPEGTRIHRSMLVPLPADGRTAIAGRAELTPDPAHAANLAAADLQKTRIVEVSSLATVEVRTGPSDATSAGVGVSTFRADGRPRRKRLAAMVGGTLGVLVVIGAVALVRPKGLGHKPAAAAAAPVALAPDVPKTSVVKITVPAAAKVTVDDEEAKNTEGVVEIRGAIGSRHRVVLRANTAETSADVVVTQDGAFPSALSLPVLPASAPPRAVAGSAPKDVPARRVATPSSPPVAKSQAPASTATQPAGIKIQKSFE